MDHKLWTRSLSIIAIGVMMNLSTRGWAADPRHVDEDGAIEVPSFVFPESSLLSDESRATLKNERRGADERSRVSKACPPGEHADVAQMPAIRRCEAEAFYATSSYKRLRELYSVAITTQQTGGIYTEVFVPRNGISRVNENRILVNLHGGGFLGGSLTLSHLESVPIAAVGRIKVVSIDYRQAPEYRFPAASEDVAAVYRELLKSYRPKNIGIYGCSAGGLLTAETVAWLQAQHLPPPGAVGMFCAGASYWTEGDSGYLGSAMLGISLARAHENPYFRNASPEDPLAFPAQSLTVMAKFPPSLLISGTRDLALSSVVHTHSLLIAQGVESDLLVWEGLGHAFFFDPDLPESREVYGIIAKFFDRHLGK
jgi:monoterpene epsilon-lactone hydrolase